MSVHHIKTRYQAEKSVTQLGKNVFNQLLYCEGRVA